MRRDRDSSFALILSSLALALAALVFVLARNQDRFGPWLRGLSLLVALLFFLIGSIVLLPILKARFSKSRRQKGEAGRGPEAAPLPADLAKAARVQADRAGEFIDRVSDPRRRAELARELTQLHADRQGTISSLSIVVFGTVSAGKTSLINALIGQEVGRTEAVMGTTRHGASHHYQVKSFDARVELTDTPGMSEAGEEGEAREIEARSLAVRADLLLFVIDHDLIRSEYSPLIELARLGKRSIVVLNKKDLFPNGDLAAILAKLRERLSGTIDPADIVAVAAAPRPLTVRIQQADGSFTTVLEKEAPDIAALLARIVELLRGEGDLLHAANLLVRGRVLERDAQEELAKERDRRALEAVEHHMWVTAATVFANPIPALDVMAGGAVQFDMIAELARIYDANLTPSQVRGLAGQMVQSVLKLGLIEAATSLIAGVFKRTLVGFAAGGTVQAVTMAYLTRVSGKAFIDYFRQGQAWTGQGIDEAVLSQFDQTSRSKFLHEFASLFVQRILERLQPVAAPGGTSPGRRER